MTLKNWLALIGLTLSAFIFNTSEFIPIGLLTDIAKDFQVTEAVAGMIISVYAWVVMLFSLPLMLIFSNWDLKRLMVTVMAVFVTFQFLSSASTGYYMLMFSRIGVACSHSIFWSIVAPLACRIVPTEKKPIALSMIVTGSAIAMILGMPIGRVIGLNLGWRMTFLSIGIFSAAILLYLSFALPPIPSRGSFSIKKLPVLLKNRLLVYFFLLTMGIATAYFECYGYIEPFLKQVVGMSDQSITSALMVFGVAGLVGSYIFSKFYNRNPHCFITLCIACMAICLGLLTPLSGLSIVIFSICAFWGIAATDFNVAFQSELIRITPPEGTAVAMSIYSGIFNFGIGTGTFIGGHVFTHISPTLIGYVGCAILVIVLLFWWFIVSPRFHQSFK